MPLLQSVTKEAMKKNMKTEMKHGKKHSQAMAIALETQRRAKSDSTAVKAKAVGGRKPKSKKLYMA